MKLMLLESSTVPSRALPSLRMTTDCAEYWPGANPLLFTNVAELTVNKRVKVGSTEGDVIGVST